MYICNHFIIAEMPDVKFWHLRDGSLDINYTSQEALAVQRRYKQNGCPQIIAASAFSVNREAIAEVERRGGDVANIWEVASCSKVQFGQYALGTMQWVMNHDIDYVDYLKRTTYNLQALHSNLGANKKLLIEYFLHFEEVQVSVKDVILCYISVQISPYFDKTKKISCQQKQF